MAALPAARAETEVASPQADLVTTLTCATDAELARSLIDGTPGAARITWQRFLPLVKRMLRRSLGGNGEVEDVAQSVFLCLFRRVHTLREPAALRAFVIAITLRIVREELRRRRKFSNQRIDHDVAHEDAMSVDADASAKHAFVNLHRLLERLRERERAAFMLRFVEGMDVAEVAQALGVSEPTARRSFSRALKRVSLWAGRDPFLVDYMRRGDVSELG